MISRSIRVLLLAIFVIGLSTPFETAQAAPQTGAANQAASPEGFLNPDGTLKLDGSFSGTLDLQGWNVQLDGQRGPVFSQGTRTQASSPSNPSPGNWGAVGAGGASLDGPVFGVAVSGTDVYVVGDFTDVANNPAADYVAEWNGSSWSALGSNGAGDGAFTNIIYAVAVSGSDVYVGGPFAHVNNDGTVLPAASHIAMWDGSNWSALANNGSGGGSLNGNVYALAVSGTDLYVGGTFTDVNNYGTVLTAADYIAMWDGSNWSALGSDGAGGGSLNGSVFAIAVNSTKVYVGGYFTDVNNNGTVLTAADFIAKWNGSNWSALGNNGAGNGSLGGAALAIAVSGSDVYAGGYFTSVNNGGTSLTGADYIAEWDGSNWLALGGNGAGGGSLNGAVLSIAASGANVYVGGTFTNVNNNGTSLNAADYVAQWDGSNWSALGSNGAGDGSIPNKTMPEVVALAVGGTGNVIVGGTFYDVNNGGSVLGQADFIAQWSSGNWSSLGTSPNGSLYNHPAGHVNAIAVMGTNVYVGGVFKNISNYGGNLPSADYVAKWDGTNWSALGSDGAGGGALSGEVTALAVSGADLYVGGNFADVNNNGTVLTSAWYIAKWNGSNWSALGSDGAGGPSLNNRVDAIAVSGSNVYVGGTFSNVNNNGTVLGSAAHIAKWDGSNWSALGSDGAGGGSLNKAVYALAVSGTNLYVGGAFTNVNNNGTVLTAADYIAKWDGTNWSALGSDGAGNGSLNMNVFSLGVNGPYLYVGGGFSGVNNGGTVLTAAYFLARWDGSNWSALGDDGAGGPSLNGPVYAVLVDGKYVYAGGYFTIVNNHGTLLNNAAWIAKWDGSNWSALGSNGAGGGSLNSPVFSLAVETLDLLAGGLFENVDNNGTVINEADYIAAYEPPYTPSFADVPSNYWAAYYIQAIYDAGITGGCGTSPLIYCPTYAVTRDQMAVFLLKGIHGSAYTPPPVGGSTGFSDVPTSYWAAAWIKELAAENITGGCGGGNFCPAAAVTRDQMAVFLLKAEHGSSYTPPPVGVSTGFADVPTSYWAAAWIKQLAGEGITGGCGGGNYCPTAAVTRDQMAVFLVKTFNLLL